MGYQGPPAEPEWAPRTDDERLAELIDDLRDVEPLSPVRILCGHGGLDVYGGKEFSDRVRELRGGASPPAFRVITGPVVVVDDDYNNRLLTLKKDGMIDLLHRSTRWADAFYWIVKTGKGYRYHVEDIDPIGPHKFNCADFSEVPEREVRALVERDVESFDRLAHRLEGASLAQGIDAPVLIPRKRLDQLIAEVKDSIAWDHIPSSVVANLLGPGELQRSRVRLRELGLATRA